GGDGDSLLGKKIAHRVGAAFGELLIEFVAANAVGVTFDLQCEAGMRQKNAGYLGQFFARPGFKRVAAGIEKDVRHVHDQAAGGIARLQNGIQLCEKLSAKLRLFGFGLRGRLARFFGFLLSGGAIASGLFGGGLRALASRSSAAFLSAAIFACASSSAFCFTAMTRASSAVPTTSRAAASTDFLSLLRAYTSSALRSCCSALASVAPAYLSARAMCAMRTALRASKSSSGVLRSMPKMAFSIFVLEEE